MKRTARYETQPLNRDKWRELGLMVNAFSETKDTALRALARTAAWDFLDHPRQFRDQTKAHYREGVPVHLQDQAVFDAVHTMRRFVEAGIVSSRVKAKVFGRYSGEKHRYAFWLLKSYARLGSVLQGMAPVPEFAVPIPEQKEVVRFLRRCLRHALGSPPRVRLRRSLCVDDTLYRVFEHKGRQYVAVASLTPRERLILPLRGKGRVGGNVRIVLDSARRTASVHMPYDVRQPAQPAAGEPIGLDAGVTEVLASSSGTKYGPGYGKLLEQLSRVTNETGRARNRLHQLAKRAAAKGDQTKACRVRRNNLGQKKLRARRSRGEAAVKTIVGRAVRQALQDRPAVVAMEDLSHLRGPAKSRKLSRIVSRWARSALRERLEFRAEAGGSRLETVNAAYTSQTCPVPTCGYVHKDNRHGDRFHCPRCGWDGDADVVAGMNLLHRLDDPDINQWTPKIRVKAILMDRFRRRKEPLLGTPLPAGL